MGVTVDASGTIYISNYQGPGRKGGFGSVTTYTPDGKRPTPMITRKIVLPELITLH